MGNLFCFVEFDVCYGNHFVIKPKLTDAPSTRY